MDTHIIGWEGVPTVDRRVIAPDALTLPEEIPVTWGTDETKVAGRATNIRREGNVIKADIHLTEIVFSLSLTSIDVEDDGDEEQFVVTEGTIGSLHMIDRDKWAWQEGESE